MSLGIDTPYISSPWIPVSPGELDLSQRVGDDQRARDLAAAWAESLGETPAAYELSSPAAAGDPAKALAARWEKENA